MTAESRLVSVTEDNSLKTISSSIKTEVTEVGDLLVMLKLL